MMLLLQIDANHLCLRIDKKTSKYHNNELAILPTKRQKENYKL